MDHQRSGAAAVTGSSSSPYFPAAGAVPLRELAAQIGPVDFSSLLIAKGLETKVLVEESYEDPERGKRYGYGLNP